MLNWFSSAMDAFNAVTNPAGFIGGQPQGQMMSQGLKSAISTSRQISNSMGGGEDDAAESASSSVFRSERPEFALGGQPLALLPASWAGPLVTSRPTASRPGWQGAPDYKTLSQPRTISFESLAPGAVTPEHAQAVNTVLATTFRMAMVLEAAATAQRRLDAAVKVRDMEWQDRQGRALVYLKRAAGLEMVQLARDLDALKVAARDGPSVTEQEAREAQGRLAANGWTPAAVNAARQLGLTDAQLEESRQQELQLDPLQTALSIPLTLDHLQDALYRYGGYLALLPDIRPPWN